MNAFIVYPPMLTTTLVDRVGIENAICREFPGAVLAFAYERVHRVPALLGSTLREILCASWQRRCKRV
jgi:hypothetical protein